MENTTAGLAAQTRARVIPTQEERWANIDRRIDAKQTKRRRKLAPWQLYLKDLPCFFRARYGYGGLPDDDAGRDDLFVYAQCLRHKPGDLAAHIKTFANVYAAWLGADGAAALAKIVTEYPEGYTAEGLGNRLGMTEEERGFLRCKSIRAAGTTDAQMRARRTAANTATRRKKRRAEGMRDQAEIRAEAAFKAERLKEAGIHRTTEYRRRKKAQKENAMQQACPQQDSFNDADTVVAFALRTMTAKRTAAKSATDIIAPAVAAQAYPAHARVSEQPAKE